MKDFLVREYAEKDYGEKNLILVIYDIIDNNRRVKFFKFLSGYLTPVQKSCFEAFLDDEQLEKIISKIDSYINVKEDNVRIYRLSAHGKVYNFGIETGREMEEIVII